MRISLGRGIQTAVSPVLESLLLVAEEYSNPVLGVEAARKAVPVADITA